MSDAALTPTQSATEIVKRLTKGESSAADELFPLVYQKLRSLAAGLVRGRSTQSLQPTALVHEAYLQLVAGDPGRHGRAHFVAVAVKAMRDILVSYVRRRRAATRGGGWHRTTLSDLIGDQPIDVDILDLDDALKRFAARHPRQAQMVELRFFSGMTGDEIAEFQGISRRAVHKNLAMARAWLLREMARGDDALRRP